jgi:hypothetical protein
VKAEKEIPQLNTFPSFGIRASMAYVGQRSILLEEFNDQPHRTD